MADPQYPNVPDTPGVPPVRRKEVPPKLTLVKEKASITKSPQINKWGIYTTSKSTLTGDTKADLGNAKGGDLAVEPDSIVAVDYAVDYRIADYPLEKGGFESYDKVSTPFETRVTMTKGGTLAERTKFLAAVQRIQSGLDLYDVVTPEKTYLNVNIAHVSLSRASDRGATLLTVELQLREIRQTATAAFTKSESPVPPPTATQDKRPPTTNPGTTRKPASSRRVSNGAAQPKQIKPMSAAEEKRIQDTWSVGARPREVVFQ